MFEKLEKRPIFKKAIIAVFLICFSYWTYLIFASQMLIQFDAIGYEGLGLMIYEKGWVEFFKTGPHREPLYTLSIALSMRIANMFSISYQIVQKIIQVMILFTTQILMLILLTKLKINNRIKLMSVLYFGFSPAVVNSAFSLFSEIMVYPFVLAIILGGYYSWRAVHCDKVKKVILFAAVTALSFACAAFVKGIFQYIFLFFLIPYVYIVINSLIKRHKRILCNAILYIITTFIIFGAFVISYRFVNKVYNGKFAFTNRYDVLLFGNAAKRVNKLNTELFIAHIVSIPGSGVCRAFFSEDTCKYCEFHYADIYHSRMLPKLLVSVPENKRHIKTISLAFEKFSENPLQYFFLTIVESLKMPFWESTQIGNVAYPNCLRWLFNFLFFKNGIRFIISLLTYISLIYLIRRAYKNRSKLYAFGSDDDSVRTQLSFFILLLIITFTGLYSLFSILTRFAFPIVPLYFLCIALFCQNVFYEKIL